MDGLNTIWDRFNKPQRMTLTTKKTFLKKKLWQICWLTIFGNKKKIITETKGSHFVVPMNKKFLWFIDEKVIFLKNKIMKKYVIK